MPGAVDITGGGPPSPGAVRAILLDEGLQAMRTSTTMLHGEVLHRMSRSRRTGHAMRNTFMRAFIERANRVLGLVGNPLDYVAWGERGTGLYGPLNRRITPKRAQALRFPEPGNPGFTLAGRVRRGRAGQRARYVYAKWVRGMRPRRWFRDAQFVVEPKVVRVFNRHADQAARRIGDLWFKRS